MDSTTDNGGRSTPANDDNLFNSQVDPVSRITLNVSGAREIRRAAAIAAFCAAGAILVLIRKPEIIDKMPVYLNPVIVTAVAGSLAAVLGFGVSCYMHLQAERAQQEIVKLTGKRYEPLSPRAFRKRLRTASSQLRRLRR